MFEIKYFNFFCKSFLVPLVVDRSKRLVIEVVRAHEVAERKKSHASPGRIRFLPIQRKRNGINGHLWPLS